MTQRVRRQEKIMLGIEDSGQREQKSRLWVLPARVAGVGVGGGGGGAGWRARRSHLSAGEMSPEEQSSRGQSPETEERTLIAGGLLSQLRIGR